MPNWTHIAAFLAIAAPVAGVPLTLITLYLRALRDQYTGRVAELASQVERLAAQSHALSHRLTEVERSSTTREEWIRENMLGRKERRLLTNAVIRIQCHIQSLKEGAQGAPFFAQQTSKIRRGGVGHADPLKTDPPTEDDS